MNERQTVKTLLRTIDDRRAEIQAAAKGGQGLDLTKARFCKMLDIDPSYYSSVLNPASDKGCSAEILVKAARIVGLEIALQKPLKPAVDAGYSH